VNRAVESGARLLAFDAFEDHRDVAHRAADESALIGERRRAALSHTQ
jgi:hypothetical protein